MLASTPSNGYSVVTDTLEKKFDGAPSPGKITTPVEQVVVSRLGVYALWSVSWHATARRVLYKGCCLA